MTDSLKSVRESLSLSSHTTPPPHTSANTHVHNQDLQPPTPLHISHTLSPPRPRDQSPFAPGPRSFSSSSLSSLDTVSNSSNSSELSYLFTNNRLWAKSVGHQYPGFFQALSQQQKPKLMWIGCSDSRVPASEITGLMPGEVFVHRNIANCVVHADLNLLSCMQFAIDVLKVEHIIVCGHYGCGGVNLALSPTQIGLCDNWVRNIKDVARRHRDQLGKYTTHDEKCVALVELNIVAQVENVCHSTIVQNAWRRGQSLAVHGWVYGVHNGLLRNLVEPSIKGFDQISSAYHVDEPVDAQEP